MCFLKPLVFLLKPQGKQPSLAGQPLYLIIRVARITQFGRLYKSPQGNFRHSKALRGMGQVTK